MASYAKLGSTLALSAALLANETGCAQKTPEPAMPQLTHAVSPEKLLDELAMARNKQLDAEAAAIQMRLHTDREIFEAAVHRCMDATAAVHITLRAFPSLTNASNTYSCSAKTALETFAQHAHYDCASAQKLLSDSSAWKANVSKDLLQGLSVAVDLSTIDSAEIQAFQCMTPVSNSSSALTRKK